MAGELEVQIEDEAVVVVDLSADPELAGLQADEEAAPPKEAKEAPAPRTPSAADAAAAALDKARKEADESRRAVEAANATAMAERRRADEATRVAQQLGQDVVAAREQTQSSRLLAITADIENAKSEVASAEGEYQRAMEAGEFALATKAQSRLAKAAARLDRQETAKADFEANAGRTPVHEGAVTPPPAPPVDPFEQYVASSNFSPQAQMWMRAHRDCAPAEVGGDPTKNAKMMKGHWAAKEKGVAVNSPEYFKVIEDHINDSAPEPAAAPAPRQVPQRRAAPSAPPSRDVPSADGSSQRSVKLSPQQQEVALFSYPATPGENETAWKKRAFGTYATEFLRAQAEGKIGRLTH